jgi:hypothetical protein
MCDQTRFSRHSRPTSSIMPSSGPRSVTLWPAQLPFRVLMRTTLIAGAVTGFAQASAAGEISSVYTDLVIERDCTTYYTSPKDGSEPFGEMTCSGYRGYPVLLSYGDARVSMFFGFPPVGDRPRRESFNGFNSPGTDRQFSRAKIEWRVETEGDRSIPFATILRWSVTINPDPLVKDEQVLVVSKVAQMAERNGCVIARGDGERKSERQ